MDHQSSKCEKIDEAIGNGVADEELGINLIRAAMDGNVKIFDDSKPSKLSDKQFFRKSCEKNNIIHIAVRYGKKEFLEAFLKKYFDINKMLITEENYQGNTPLHVAAEVGNLGIVKMLFNYLKESVEGHEGDEAEKPWRAQNSEGNAALHVALLYHNFFVVRSLLKQDRGLARIVNNSKEAPLHLAITQALDFGADNKLSIIKNLLIIAKSVASWPDGKGLTPLHRAASLNPPFNLQITKQIIQFCPQSTLVCDASGKSILHHLANKIFGIAEIKDLLGLPEIYFLRNHQDQEGNTPLHIAAKCNNINMVNVLMTSFAKPHIKNRDGISAVSVIQQQDFHQPVERRSMTREEFSSAYKGNIEILSEKMRYSGINFLASQDSEERNVLHLLMHTGQKRVNTRSYSNKLLDFMKKALETYPLLVCQTDQTRNSPLHILARNKDLSEAMSMQQSNFLSNLLSICAKALLTIKPKRFHNNSGADYNLLPWVVQNGDDNTPLHEAIIAKNKVLVHELLSYSEETALLVNKHKETPLHLLAGTCISGMNELKVEDILMKFVKANIKALGLPDKDGLTPVSRAVEAENLDMVVALLHSVKKASNIIADQTFWHHLLQHPSFVKNLLKHEVFRKMLEQKNKYGNTLLHLAMTEVDDLDLATRLCHQAPEAATIGDIYGRTFWHLLLKHQSYKSKDDVKGLFEIEALKKGLERKDKDENTPLHLAIKEKRFDFVQDVLDIWGSEHESSEQSKSNQFLMDLIRIPDKDGLTPIIRAIKADNLKLATKMCRKAPEAAKMGDFDGRTFWHLLLKHPSYNSNDNVKDLLQIKALRKELEQKDKDGNTPLHLAIKEKRFDFVELLLETCKSERDEVDHLLRINNNVGETPEDLLADSPTLSKELEEELLTDRRMMGIRSWWRIPRTQLQNYMSSMNVIAALQTTFTFTAAFTVPGGLNQDIGTPILIRRIPFQVFMISDVIAMCLSMMVLICLLWMVATTNKRESVMIQDFALTLLLLSFVATLLTFMAGVYATIYPAKPWIAITTLVLCSLLMLFFPIFVLTKLLLHFKYPKVRFVKKMFSRPADSSNTQEQRSVSVA